MSGRITYAGHPLEYRLENGAPWLCSLGADGVSGGTGSDEDLTNQPGAGQNLVAQAF